MAEVIADQNNLKEECHYFYGIRYNMHDILKKSASQSNFSGIMHNFLRVVFIFI